MKANIMQGIPEVLRDNAADLGTRRVFTRASRKNTGTICGKTVSPRWAHGPNGVQASSFFAQVNPIKAADVAHHFNFKE